MFSPPFRSVLLKSIGLALLLIVIIGIGSYHLLGWLAGAGEGWAETYRVLNERKAGLAEVPWHIVSQALYPTAAALTAAEQDVITPWQAGTTTTRVAPALSTSSSRPRLIPPIANQGRAAPSSATCDSSLVPVPGRPSLVGVSHTGPAQK